MKFKKGDLVTTWLSDKVGKVVKYDPINNQVTVKTKGYSGVDILPAERCRKVG